MYLLGTTQQAIGVQSWPVLGTGIELILNLQGCAAF